MGKFVLQAMFADHGLLIGENSKFCDDGVPGQFDEWTQEGSVEFEPDSGGAWKGMTTEEHMRFAEDLPHQGHKAMDVDVPEELLAALKFCSENTAVVIDEFRNEFLVKFKEMQAEVEEARAKWFAEEVPPPHKKLMSGINVFFIQKLQELYDIKDELLVTHLTWGFPMTGEMTSDAGGLREEAWDQGHRQEDVVPEAMTINKRTVAKVREN